MICSKCGKECKEHKVVIMPVGYKLVSHCCENVIIFEENKMEKVLFEREEKAYNHYLDILKEFKHNDKIFAKDLVIVAKQKVYIKQSAVEEAEEMWKSIQSTFSNTGNMTDDIFRIANNYIQELKNDNRTK